MIQYRTIAFFILLCSIGFTSCRTSQQESRRATGARGQSAAAAQPVAAAARADSLLMIERKLSEVIDSMTSLVQSDHNRIRTLERELQELRSQMGGGNSAMPPPPIPQ